MPRLGTTFWRSSSIDWVDLACLLLAKASRRLGLEERWNDCAARFGCNELLQLSL